MQRVQTILLAILAVIVFVAAGYVIAHNGSGGRSSQQDSFTAPTIASATPDSSSTPADTSPSAAAKKVVVFLGDEWTSGATASSKAKRFTTIVATQLGVTERNLGKSGSGYADGADYGSRLDAVVSAHPDVVVVSGGRNDVVAGNGTAADASAATLFRDLHRKLPAVVLVAVAPMWGDSNPPSALGDLATAVRKAVTAEGGTYLDVADPLNGHPEFMADASDPDDRGYAAIAAALEPKLAPLA
ncbi:MAG: SGNH/GDSL hydrolase family protein [Actinomycetota bacterium]|nr:SGNH/GDSL hydrolase family protein [Actinomycetota bacterium]